MKLSTMDYITGKELEHLGLVKAVLSKPRVLAKIYRHLKE